MIGFWSVGGKLMRCVLTYTLAGAPGLCWTMWQKPYVEDNGHNMSKGALSLMIVEALYLS